MGGQCPSLSPRRIIPAKAKVSHEDWVGRGDLAALWMDGHGRVHPGNSAQITFPPNGSSLPPSGLTAPPRLSFSLFLMDVRELAGEERMLWAEELSH